MYYSVNSYRKVAIEKRFSDLKDITEETTKYVLDSSLAVPEDFKIACGEVMSILSNTKQEIKDEIPQNMFAFLAANRIAGSKADIDYEKDIDENDLTEKASLLIAIIYRSYLCPNKEALDQILIKNDKKKNKEKDKDKAKVKKNSIADLEEDDIEEITEDAARLRRTYLAGLENFDTLDDYLDDEYEFNKFLEEREEDFTDDLSFKEKVDLKKLDRKTRKRAAKEVEMFEDRLERIDFNTEKMLRKEKSIIYKLKNKISSKKKEEDEE